jgi:predicted nucleic acid-binding protein
MYLLDTNVISELRRDKPGQSAVVRAWAQNMPVNQLYLSSITILELDIGVRRMERKDARQGHILRVWLEATRKAFTHRILGFSAETALLCAAMHVPDPKSFRDSMIAATARQHACTLVTRNVPDFEGMDIEILNPWER